MGYLSYLPKFTYTLAKLSGTVSDIFRRVAFTQKSRNDPKNYSEYLSEGILTPDRLSNLKLNNPDYYWQILMMNNIVNENEFADSYRDYTTTVNSLINGQGLFFDEFFGSNIRPGDIAYVCLEGNTVDFTQGGVISKYDLSLRKISMKHMVGGGFPVPVGGATAAIYGYDDGGSFILKGNQTIIRSSELSNCPVYFYDANDRETSPYLFPSGMAGGTFADPLGITVGNNTLLKNYMDGTSLPTGFFFRSEIQDYRNDQLKLRNLKIPPIALADQIDQEAHRLITKGIQKEIGTVSSTLTRLGSSTTTTIDSSSGSN
jgi:hypothetical protein